MVKKVSRRLRDAQAKVENKAYEPLEALTLLKELATAKFDETAEAHIRLGIRGITNRVSLEWTNLIL